MKKYVTRAAAALVGGLLLSLAVGCSRSYGHSDDADQPVARAVREYRTCESRVEAAKKNTLPVGMCSMGESRGKIVQFLFEDQQGAPWLIKPATRKQACDALANEELGGIPESLKSYCSTVRK